VAVEQEVYDPDTRRLVGFKGLQSMELVVENLDRRVTAPGPGVVRLVQPGGGVDTALGDPAARPKKAPADSEWAMTLVTYGRFGDPLGKGQEGAGRMDADNVRHTATFYEDVQLLHVPWPSDPKRLREPVSVSAMLERLPPGGLYMECRKKLQVYSPEEAPGKPPAPEGVAGKHIMTGIGQVYLKSTDAKGQVFWGNAEEIHYDEEKEQVIFDGKDGLAEVYQVERRGEEPKKTRAQKIIYWRKTGKMDVNNVTEIRGH
jgi:hypothetical protein